MHLLPPLAARQFALPIHSTLFLRPSYGSCLLQCHSRAYSFHRSPKARAATKSKPQLPPQSPTSTSSPKPRLLNRNDTAAWPTASLAQAYTSGAIPVPANQAIAIMQDFGDRITPPCDLGKVGREICEAHSLSPSNLTSFALALLGSKDAMFYPPVKHLLMAASAMHDPRATITYLRFTQTKTLRNLTTARIDLALYKELVRLVAAGNPEAMDLQADIDMNEGRTARAIELSEKVAKSDGDEYSKLHAWRRLAQLRAGIGDWSGVQAALWIAAGEYDDSWAYYTLAENYMSLQDKDQMPFFQKAAASGVQMAANKLGDKYLTDYINAVREGTENRSSSKRALQMAVEWFLVFIEGPPNTASFHAYIQLGLIYRERGEKVKGREMMSLAEQQVVEVQGLGELAKVIPWLKERWEGEDGLVTMWKGVRGAAGDALGI